MKTRKTTKKTRADGSRNPVSDPAPNSLTLSSNQFPVVGIGASAGGLDAFKRLLKAIPENSGMAFVLVQHLDPKHESMLPELLQKITKIPVLEITDDIKVLPDHIYIIPSNKMMIANDGVLLLSPRPANKNERNLPVDLFFSSLAEVHQSHSIGVVLSGTASDGTKGLKAIKDHGGITIAQDEESAAYNGMPHSAIQAGVVDFILPPEDIPQKLVEITKVIAGNGISGENLPQQEFEVFNQVLSLLRIRKGTDFTYYKQTTIRRRILRRMALNKNDEPAAYLKYLRENKAEQDVLYQDLLIPVTAFFRDIKTFDNLCKTVFPAVVKNIKPTQPIRIWVAGCSTGEEAYSIAICLKEFLGSPQERVQVFATDISEPAIAKARAGIYSKSEIEGLSDQRLQEFFMKVNGRFQVIRQVRDMCVFAVHNFLKDPPFGRMDLISCRNVLIYMEPYLQKKALTTFHYALNPKGFLLLGKSETISSVSDLFGVVQKGEKLFSRKDVPAKYQLTASLRAEQSMTDMNVAVKPETPGRMDFQKTADDIILTKYTPSGVVVNEEMDIVHFRGKTGNYLEQLPGKPSHNLIKMAKDGLAFELRNIIHKVKKEKTAVTKENIPLQVNGMSSTISIEAIPLPNTAEPHYLILFHEERSAGHKPIKRSNKNSASDGSKEDDKDLRIQQLEQQLAQVREDMRSITEEQEAANEELQSANEELLSSGEEMQSLNEELETGKEELQSTNEELIVVNQEMISLNEQVTAARDYAENIIANIREPFLVLDKNQRVVTANRSFYKIFRVNEQETEDALIYNLGNKQWNIPSLKTLLEKILPEHSVFNDFEVTIPFPNIGERTMLLNARSVKNEKNGSDLILLSIEDITEQKKATESLKRSSEHLRQLVQELPAGVYSCDAEGYIIFYNNAAAKLWGRAPEIGKERWCGSWKLFSTDGTPLPLDRCPMAIALKEQRAIMGEELIVETPDGARSNVLVYPQPEFNLAGELTGAINMVFDITELVNARKKIEESEAHFRLMADLMPAKISNASIAGDVTYFNKQWLDFTGMSFEELKDFGYHKIMHPDEIEEFQERFQKAAESGTVLEMEMRFMNTAGEYVWHLNLASPVKDNDGHIKMWVGVTTDISDQVRTRVSNLESYETHSKELEEKVQQRTIELIEANKELQKKNKELESFNYISSHDLQEPLRKIQIFANRIIGKEYELLSEKGKDAFSRIQDAAHRMQTLIEDLLAYSRTNIKDRKLEQTELGEIVEETRKEFSETIREKGAILEVGPLCSVYIDPVQFRQVMNNLVANALKFSKAGIAPHIIIKSKTTEGSELLEENPALAGIRISGGQKYCHISVSDNGIGFDPKYKDQIFEVFQRLYGKDEYPGTGIGLAIVKKIVENHNGMVTATGSPDKGATFDIYIPFGE